VGGRTTSLPTPIEDNDLWLRHLQTLTVQVAAVAYVRYESSVLGSRSLLLPAAVIMFAIGVVKYGERVWPCGRSIALVAVHRAVTIGHSIDLKLLPLGLL
jgi:hypothetical protein